MPRTKKSPKSGFQEQGKIYRSRIKGNRYIEPEAVIYAKKTEGRNYALTRTYSGYPSVMFLQEGELERLESEGVKRISLKKALQRQDDFLKSGLF